VRRRPPGRPAPLFRAAALLGLAVPAGLTAQRPALADGTLPPTTLLYQNFPNPFPAGGRDSTCIWFDLAGRGGAGGPTCDPRLMWDGRADDGRVVPAGVYLYKLTARGVIQFRRIVFRGRNR